MATPDYTALIEQLNTISNKPSDSGNRRGYSQARAAIMASDLSDSEKENIRLELHNAADTNQGYHYNSNGIHGALRAIKTLIAANDADFDPKTPTSLSINELTQKVSNGLIFGVSFTKRTTGELRTMSCRLGVKKFLRDGKMAYSPAERDLLTVFSMSDNGYRCIPLNTIKELNIAGESFCVEGS